MKFLYSVLSIVLDTERHGRKTSPGLHHQGAEPVLEQTNEHSQVSNAVRGCDKAELSVAVDGLGRS